MSATAIHSTERLLETTIFKRLTRACKDAAKKGQWIAVMGEVGTGKSTIMRSCMVDWLQTDRYKVTYVPGLRHRGSRAHAVMGAMLQTLSPQGRISQNSEQRYVQLAGALHNQAQAGRRVVLVIDNAHDLTEATIQDIKKLHEITVRGRRNLFAVLFFARSDQGKLDPLLSGSRELGYRIRRLDMAPWNEAEVFDLIQHLGGRWEAGSRGEKARAYYLQQMPRIPLAAEYMLDRLALNPQWDGLITEDRLKMVMRQSFSDLMTAYQITYRDIIDRVRAEHGKDFSKSSVSAALNGTGKIGQRSEAVIIETMETLLREKRNQ